MKLKFYHLIILLLLVGCANKPQSKFQQKYSAFSYSIKESSNPLKIFQPYFQVNNPEDPSNYMISFPQAIDTWGYAEIGLQYDLNEREYKKISESLKVNSKFSKEVSSKKIESTIINKNVLNSFSDKCVIPQIEYNKFYIDENLSSNAKIYVLHCGDNLIFKQETLSEIQQSSKNHGYSLGAIVDDTEKKVIYWLIAW